MNFRGWALAMTGLCTALGSAQAQDQRRPVDIPPYQPVQTWTGFYLGAGFGGAVMVDHQSSSAGAASVTTDSGGQGVLASVYGGYDFQVLPQALVGVLAEGNWSGAQSQSSVNVGGANATASIQPDWGFSAVIRAGVMPTPSNLLYLLGGYSGQNFHSSGSALVPGAVASFTRDDWFNGWTVGGGLETRLQGGWSAKLEYRYSQFENKVLSGTNILASPSLQSVRAGLTYKFGEFAANQPDPGGSAKANWTGLYLGGAGGVIGSTYILGASVPGASASTSLGGQGVMGGVFGGFDYQFADQAVVGIMGDLTWANPQALTALSGFGAGASVTTTSSMAWSVMGRLGYLPMPSTLLYAAAGYTGEQINTTISAFVPGAGGVASENDVVNGWTIGPGIETVIADGWSTRLEYRYSQYETKTVLGGATVQPSNQTIRAGLSYRFGVGK